MGTILDDPYHLEGYGARRLPDGTITAGWTAETAAFEAYVAACDCGWHGGADHPPTDDGCEAAVDVWEHDHARLLLATTVPPEVSEAVAEAKRLIGVISRSRPEAARRVLDDLEAWSTATRRRLDPATRAERMRSQLEGLGRRDPGTPRTLGR